MIDLWSFALDARLAAPETLDVVERARLDRMRSQTKRLEFAVGRTVLRHILGNVLDIKPAEVRLEYGAHGKPLLAGDELTFNLSHSGDRAAVALAADGRVGIDVERRRPRRPFQRLSRRFFAAAEDRWLRELPASARADAFYRVWTLKEAYLKAIGTGLTFSSRRFALDPRHTPPCLQTTQYPGDRPDRWSFATPELCASHAAAVCWEGADLRIRHREVTELFSSTGSCRSGPATL